MFGGEVTRRQVDDGKETLDDIGFRSGLRIERRQRLSLNNRHKLPLRHAFRPRQRH